MATVSSHKGKWMLYIQSVPLKTGATRNTNTASRLLPIILEINYNFIILKPIFQTRKQSLLPLLTAIHPLYGTKFTLEPDNYYGH